MMADMQLALPNILDLSARGNNFPLDITESKYLTTARRLFDSGFYDHALLDLWNASIHNLRRRVEAYGVDLFVSVTKDETGRKKYAPDGETIQDRWSGVDDLILISGATRLGLVGRKAGKTLEMLNWMRNHASAAHATEEQVGPEDVALYAVILEKDLLSQPLPDAGHSVASLFEPVKKVALGENELELADDQIKALRPQDLRTCFGFLLDLLALGQEPGLSNAKSLLPTAWQLVSEDVRKVAGLQYHSYTLDPSADTSKDQGAKTRIFEFLVIVKGIAYIPDSSRASVYRGAARRLAQAKDESYGWENEEVAAKILQQFGPHVPSIAFEEVYQEIVAVWCGNTWGRSKACNYLQDFIDTLNTEKIRELVRLFYTNKRIQSELFLKKPKENAIDLLERLKSKLTITSHQTEVDATISFVKNL